MTWHAYEWTDNLCPANVCQWHTPCYEMGDVSGTMESTCVAGSQGRRVAGSAPHSRSHWWRAWGVARDSAMDRQGRPGGGNGRRLVVWRPGMRQWSRMKFISHREHGRFLRYFSSARFRTLPMPVRSLSLPATARRSHRRLGRAVVHHVRVGQHVHAGGPSRGEGTLDGWPDVFGPLHQLPIAAERLHHAVIANAWLQVRRRAV